LVDQRLSPESPGHGEVSRGWQAVVREGSPFQPVREHGVRFSRGDAGRAVYALAEIGELIESGRFSLPVPRTFPLAEIAQAHRAGEDGHVRGKLVLVIGPGVADTL
jgi:NADPH:quinone reductase-like Zn-dependent oxidoreductase